MAYDNNMSGVLFKNDRKTKDTQPTYKGFCEIDNVEFWMSAWVNTAKGGPRQGQKFLSIRFEAKNQDQVKSSGSTSSDSDGASFDDDIPF